MDDAGDRFFDEDDKSVKNSVLFDFKSWPTWTALVRNAACVLKTLLLIKKKDMFHLKASLAALVVPVKVSFIPSVIIEISPIDWFIGAGQFMAVIFGLTAGNMPLIPNSTISQTDESVTI